MHFSFSTFLSVSRHIPGQTVFVSHLSRFSVFLPYSMSYNVHLSFFRFFSTLARIQVYRVYFSFFTFFNVSSHILGLTVFVSHFARFSVFLAIFQVLPCVFLIFLHCQFYFFLPYSRSFSVCVPFPTFFIVRNII